MVAGVFMHLSHEKQWIYGALLLTVLFFIVLIFVPSFTVQTRSAWRCRRSAAPAAAGIGHEGHCHVAADVSPVLHRRVGGAGGVLRGLGGRAVPSSCIKPSYAGAGVASLAAAVGLAVYGAAFQRKTKNLS